MRDVRFRKLEQFGEFIDQVQTAARTWMQLQNAQLTKPADWREAWHPNNVEVWGREADGIEDCLAVSWLHGPYRQAVRSARIPEGSIYKSSITGQMGKIGRLWHRMYPKVRLVKDPEDPKKPMPLVTRQYLELLTIFPDQSPESDYFLGFLDDEQKSFVKLWPR